MRFFRRVVAIVLVGLAGCTAGFAQAPESDRFLKQAKSKVVGGSLASIQDWPALGTMRYKDGVTGLSGHVCGGTMIAPQWLLTAAHCVVVNAAAGSLKGCFPDDSGATHCGILEVVLGHDDLTEASTQSAYEIANIIVHETYLDAYKALRQKGFKASDAVDQVTISVGHDIALVRIVRAWPGPVVRLSLAAQTDPSANEGGDLRVAGFGFSDPSAPQRSMRRFRGNDGNIFFSGSNRLLSTKLPLVETDRCRTRYRKLSSYANAAIATGQLCAGAEAGGRDSCLGDSGGPLVAYDSRDQKYQVGIVSWGHGCAEPGWYGIYTRISNYADWLRTKMGELPGDGSAIAVAATGGREPGRPANLRLADAALEQIAEVLPQGRGKVRIGLAGGFRVRLGQDYKLEIRSSVAGRLILVDIDAAGKVTQIVPNHFMASAGVAGLARIAANETLVVPPADGGWGFSDFRASPPLGTGRLLALVVPDSFPLDATVWSTEQQERAREFKSSPTASYLMNVVAGIMATLGDRNGQSQSDTAGSWGWAVADIEIVQ